MKNLIVVYKDNSLFNDFVPKLLALVPKEVNIKTVVFPHGTEKSIIIERIKPVLEEINEPTLYLSDRTCGVDLLYTDIRTEYQDAKKRGMELTNCRIDSVFNDEVKKMFEVDTFAGALLKITDQIVENPDAVVILENHIADHLYGFADAEKYASMFYEPKLFVEMLSSLLRDKYPDIPLFTIDHQRQLPNIEKDFNNLLLIADRHSEVLENSWHLENWNYKSKLLLLPFENAINLMHVQGRKVCNFDEKTLFISIFPEGF